MGGFIFFQKKAIFTPPAWLNNITPLIHTYSAYVHTAIEKQLSTADQNKRNKYEPF